MLIFADEPLDLVALVLVVLDRLAGGRGDLHHHVALRVEFARLEERREGLESQADSLGVVETVDAEQDHLGIAEAGADGSATIEFEVPDSVTDWNLWVHG
mgnify:CR=1 FL=1